MPLAVNIDTDRAVLTRAAPSMPFHASELAGLGGPRSWPPVRCLALRYWYTVEQAVKLIN